MFSSEICETFKNTFLYRTPLFTEHLRWLLLILVKNKQKKKHKL